MESYYRSQLKNFDATHLIKAVAARAAEAAPTSAAGGAGSDARRMAAAFAAFVADQCGGAGCDADNFTSLLEAANPALALADAQPQQANAGFGLTAMLFDPTLVENLQSVPLTIAIILFIAVATVVSVMFLPRLLITPVERLVERIFRIDDPAKDLSAHHMRMLLSRRSAFSMRSPLMLVVVEIVLELGIEIMAFAFMFIVFNAKSNVVLIVITTSGMLSMLVNSIRYRSALAAITIIVDGWARVGEWIERDDVYGIVTSVSRMSVRMVTPDGYVDDVPTSIFLERTIRRKPTDERVVRALRHIVDHGVHRFKRDYASFGRPGDPYAAVEVGGAPVLPAGGGGGAIRGAQSSIGAAVFGSDPYYLVDARRQAPPQQMHGTAPAVSGSSDAHDEASHYRSMVMVEEGAMSHAHAHETPTDHAAPRRGGDRTPSRPVSPEAAARASPSRSLRNRRGAARWTAQERTVAAADGAAPGDERDAERPPPRPTQLRSRGAHSPSDRTANSNTDGWESDDGDDSIYQK